jgi:hypothetical protein
MNELISNTVVNTSITYNKYHPYLYSLNRINNWFLFGSLTWERQSRRNHSYAAEYRRRIDFNYLMALFCIRYKIRRKALAFYKATEYGAAGEPHYHFLITKNACEHVSPDECATALTNAWRYTLKPYDYDHYGIGTAAIVPYEDSKDLPGVQYCLKREYNEFGIEWDRDDFLSPRLMKILIAQTINK